MNPGSQVRVALPKRQGTKFRNRVGTVLDATRSLDKPYPMVYFIRFDDLGISAWFTEDQLVVEVPPCHSDEDDPAA